MKDAHFEASLAKNTAYELYKQRINRKIKKIED